MATLRTPGVYVEEITKFPPSVAPVATAIPAFIGYTEKAEELNGDSLNMLPKRITSMLEYETYFGKAKYETTIAVEVEEKIVNNQTVQSIKVNKPLTPSPYKMYYAMQMYFANGGGPCYITSVGGYSDSIILGTTASNPVTGLEGGLSKIRKVDEPTLLLFPDAVSLGSIADFGAINNKALDQCNSLQDRFTIMDTYTSEEINDPADPIGSFRGVITSDYLKYGAAYYPHLQTILDYAYEDSGVQVFDNSSLLPQLAIDALELTIAANLVNYNSTVTSFEAETAGTLANKSTLLDLARGAMSQLVAIKSDYESIVSIGRNVSDDDDTGTDLAVVNATNVLDAAILSEIDDLISALQTKIDKLVNDSTDTKVGNSYTAIVALLTTSPGVTTLTTSTTATLSPAVIVLELAFDAYNTGVNTSSTLASLKTSDNALYNAVKAEISNLPVPMPPSSAMAGIYARIDNNSGVWKAPANTGVSYVVKPEVLISHEDQEDLNVTTSGKSINAIRTFTGKGTLVWGARTLAGNDNEWRYISVRRLFNFVEESVSEASEQFVFESNDANTWVRIRAMIENFLLLQWKAGALAGAKPEEAYYVNVGLGSTMTSQDILEGRMIVEIGMAAVRPAEFIVLRFSHKMQES